MKSWHIWDFPDTIYIYLNDNFRNEFFTRIFEKTGGKRPYARFVGLSQKTVKSYHQGYFHKNGIKYSQSIPISLFKKSISLIDEELKNKLENNIHFLKVSRKSFPILSPKLPIIESPAFYRIVAHMIGDGSVPKNHSPYYANTCKELREQFKKDLQIFGDVKIHEAKTTTTPIVCFSKAITDILSFILDVKFSYPDKIPKIIFQAPNECKSVFLQALFDDEGTISTNLAISMNNYDLVKEIKELVIRLGIATTNLSIKKSKLNGDNYSFSISRKSFKDFSEKIGFTHPKKIFYLDAAIKTQQRKQRTQPLKLTRDKIVKLLSAKQMSTLDLSKQLLLTVNGLYYHLNFLENEGLIQRNGYKNKVFWTNSKA